MNDATGQIGPGSEEGSDPDVAFMTRLVPGCTAAELAEAETRIDYMLPPAPDHRALPGGRG
jgi:hypothetical protein